MTEQEKRQRKEKLIREIFAEIKSAESSASKTNRAVLTSPAHILSGGGGCRCEKYTRN